MRSAAHGFTCRIGYHVAYITDNGAGQTVADPYVIPNVTEAHDVTVIFAAGTRASFNAGEFFSSHERSTIVSAAGGKVVCERSMYGNSRAWATDSIGFAP